ncbi:MAG: PE family protein, partial [Mycobacterium sp.]
MSFMFVSPDVLEAAARALAGIGSQVGAAAAAAVSAQQVVPAAADEVSAAIAGLFGTYAREYSATLAQAASLHDRFIASLT